MRHNNTVLFEIANKTYTINDVSNKELNNEFKYIQKNGRTLTERKSKILNLANLLGCRVGLINRMYVAFIGE